jgi:hypothetical protein
MEYDVLVACSFCGGVLHVAWRRHLSKPTGAEGCSLDYIPGMQRVRAGSGVGGLGGEENWAAGVFSPPKVQFGGKAAPQGAGRQATRLVVWARGGTASGRRLS